MTHNTLDFKKIEELRMHMLVPVGDWASLMGVSRMTYYKWVIGKAQIRSRKDAAVREQIRLLLGLVSRGWPSPEDKGLEPAQRVAKLLALLKQPQ